MKDRLSLLDYLTVAVFTLQGAFALHIGLNGPTTPIPVHFGPDLRPDRWSDRTELALTLGGIAMLGLILCVGLGLGAMRAEAAGDQSQKRSLRIGQGIGLFTLTIVGVLIAWASLGHTSLGQTDLEARGGVFMGGLSLVFVGVGAFIGRVSPNPFVGVRTPWAFKSRLAWDRSNRLAGRLFFLIGLCGLIAAPVAPQPFGVTALTVSIIAVGIIAVFESWRVWRNDPDRQPF
ncbi:SdpI family protein [Brevundimonas sp.]|uniref:SdpI family protein n=1 Tax=Brevundimonas sp. TaxID=1871086 RepID=UPI0025C384E2|nr:SdpI family protein [Brevundimonas sp.]